MGSLAEFDGLPAADLEGAWTISITDFQNHGDTPPPKQFLDNWSLNFTGGIDFSNDLPTTVSDTIDGVPTGAGPCEYNTPMTRRLIHLPANRGLSLVPTTTSMHSRTWLPVRLAPAPA